MSPEAASYFDRLFARRGSAERLDPREVRFQDGTAPRAAECHDNVDRWVRENPGCRAARGWAIETETADHASFAAHSAVDEGDGRLVDITLTGSHRFLRHEGSDDLWRRIEPTNRQRVWPPPPPNFASVEIEERWNRRLF